MALNPTEVQNQAYLGDVLNFAGHPELTLERMERIDCSTAFLTPYFCLSAVGNAYYLVGRYEEAVRAFQQALKHPSVWWGPRLIVQVELSASYSELGQEKEAEAMISEVLKVNPQFSLAGVQQRWPYKDPAVLEHFVSALRKAGLK